MGRVDLPPLQSFHLGSRNGATAPSVVTQALFRVEANSNAQAARDLARLRAAVGNANCFAADFGEFYPGNQDLEGQVIGVLMATHPYDEEMRPQAIAQRDFGSLKRVSADDLFADE